MAIRRRIYSLVVYYDTSNHPFGYEPIDLTNIAFDISDGPCVGSLDIASDVEVRPDRVGAELLAIGNDGSFFEPLDSEPVEPAPKIPKPKPVIDYLN